jgi:hypothetical protein
MSVKGTVVGIVTNALLRLSFLGMVSLGGAALAVSGLLRWALLTALVVGVVAGGWIVHGARFRARERQYKTTIEALNEKRDADANVIELQARTIADQTEQLEDKRDLLADAERRDLYRLLHLDVAGGLYYALKHVDEIHGIVRFIEQNSLKAINGTFSGALATENSPAPTVEVGIAKHVGGEIHVTHASGPYTQDLKREAPCFARDLPFEEVLRRRVSYGPFAGGDYHVVPLTNTDPLQYLFALSTVPLGTAERDSLKGQATLIKVTDAALTRLGIAN